jgi:spore germination protein KC
MKRVILVAICLALMGITTGCWNRREVETLGFVTLIGLDIVETGEFEITVHIIKPLAFPVGGDGGGSSEKPFWSLTITDDTVFGAFRKALEQSPRRLYFAHNRIILLGEELARMGIEEVIDVFDRDPEPRRTTTILVAKGLKAREVMEAEFALERTPSEGIMFLLTANKNGTSSVVDVSLNDLLVTLEEEGVEPVVGAIGVVSESAGDQDEGKLLRESITKSPILQGGAVFKNDKLVGWLDPLETRGFLWVRDKVRSGIINIKQPGVEDAFIALEIMRAGSEVKADLEYGKPKITIDVTVQADLGEVHRFVSILEDYEMLGITQHAMEQAVKHEIEMALNKTQKECNSDIFGFGMLIWRHHPKEWLSRYRESWDEEFPNLDVTVNVKGTLLRGGLTTRSTKINRAGD